MRSAFASGLAAILSLGPVVPPVAAQEPRPPFAVDVRLQTTPSEEFTAIVASLGRPSSVTHAPGQTFEDVVLQRCGRIAPAYLRAFLAENPDLGMADLGNLAGRTVLYPACARPPANVSTEIASGDRIEAFFTARGQRFASTELATAAAGQKSILDGAVQVLRDPRRLTGFEASQNAALFAMANPDVVPTALAVGETVAFPSQPISSSIALRDNVSVEQAIAMMQVVLRPAEGQATPPQAATLIHDVTATSGTCAVGKPDWPFSESALNHALAENARWRPVRLRQDPTKVLVLDTGLDDEMVGEAIPSDVLGALRPANRREGPAIHRGVNLAQNTNDVRPPPGLANRGHGGEVAATLLGGAALADAPRQLLPFVQLTFGSVATAGGSSVLSAAAIPNIVPEADASDVRVVNISLSASEARQLFSDALRTPAASKILFVVAAGNDGGDFAGSGFVWPGGFGGAASYSLRANVITVGAHDQEGRLLSFSRRSARLVDILAPGCQIPTLSGRRTPAGFTVAPVVRDGTSYAAPQVSMAAAILHSEGLTAPAIKSRLVQSAAYDPALEAHVYSSGRLDLHTALSIWRDTITYVDEGRVTRRPANLINVTDVLDLCGNQVPVRDLRKLSIAKGSATGQVRLHGWKRAEDPDQHYEMVRIGACEHTAADQGVLQFTDAQTGDAFSVEVANVIDFTPRWFD